MTELCRLSELEPNRPEARLLRAARREAPRADVRHASAVALGLTSAVVAGTATSTAAASAIGMGIPMTAPTLLGASGATATPLAGAALKVVGLAMLKGLVVGTIVSGIALQQLKPSPSPQHSARTELAKNTAFAHARTKAKRLDQPRVATVAPAPSARDEHVTREADPGRSQSEFNDDVRQPIPVAAELVSDAVSPADSAPEPNGVPESTLAEELVAFGRAQRALQHGDATTALRELAAYHRAYPQGTLTPEAKVLRIEALFALNDISNALGEAREFLKRNPDGPAARRVGSLIKKYEKLQSRNQTERLEASSP